MKIIRLLPLLLILFLHGCGLVTTGGPDESNKPQLSFPFKKEFDMGTFGKTQSMSRIYTGYVYASDDWVKLFTIPKSTYPYKFFMDPTSPIGGYEESKKASRSAVGNNVVNLCYRYTDTQVKSLDQLVSCENVSVNPVTGEKDCYGNLGETINGKNLKLVPGGKLYVVMNQQTDMLGSNPVDSLNQISTSTLYLNGSHSICKTIPGWSGMYRVPGNCYYRPNALNDCTSGLCYLPNGQCSSMAGAFVFRSSGSGREEKFIAPNMCPCSNAYKSGQLSEDFINGKCIFYNGMGYGIGYSSLLGSGTTDSGRDKAYLGSFFDGSTIFGNDIDPNYNYFNASLIRDIPQNVPSDAVANFSLVGSYNKDYAFSSDYSKYSMIDQRFLTGNPPGHQYMNTYYSLGMAYYGPPAEYNAYNYVNSDDYKERRGKNYLIGEVSGCIAIGGEQVTPLQDINDGKLEYLVLPANSPTPSEDKKGSILSDNNFNTAKLMQYSDSMDVYFRIVEKSNDRADNYGYYQVSLYGYQESSPTDFLARLTDIIINPIKAQIYLVAQQMFSNISSDSRFKSIVNASLTLYIMFFGISFLMGNTKITQKELVYRVLKIGIVLSFLNSQNAQSFFNDYLLNLFWNGTTELISYVSDTNVVVDAVTGQASLDYRQVFKNLTLALQFFFSMNFLNGLVVMLLWFPIGWVVIGFFIKNIFVFLEAVLLLMISYLIAMTAISLFIGLAPIFIILVLFEQTRETFMNWLKVMTSFAFQPVIMFAAVTVIAKIITAVVYQLIDMKMELHPLVTFQVKIPFVIDIFTLWWWRPTTFIITIIAMIIILEILAQMLKDAPQFAGEIARNLFGSGIGGSAGQIDDAAKGIMNDGKKPIGMDDATQAKIKGGDAGSGGGGGASSGAQSDGVARAKI